MSAIPRALLTACGGIKISVLIISDILSFYKEELANETNNFVHDRARVTGKGIKAVLQDILEEVINAVTRAREILQGEKEKETWERFLSGYVAFHFLSPRYKLETLTGSGDA